MRKRFVAMAAATGAALAFVSAPAAADGDQEPLPVDPYAAVTYQQNVRHDGASADPNFRGPLTRAWSVSLHGTVGYPLIVNGVVYAMYADPARRGRAVIALSAASGEVVWGPRVLGGYPNGSSGFAYDDGRLFVLDGGGWLTGLDAASGHVDWQVDLPYQWGFDSPPAARDGVVYVHGEGSGSTVYAVDESSGNLRWTRDTAPADGASITVDETGIYVGAALQHTFKYSLDGELLWVHSTTGSAGLSRTPVLHDGKLFVQAHDRAGLPLTLDAATGKVAGPATYRSWTTPAVADQRLVAVAGEALTAYDLESGDVAWEAPERGYVTSPLIANGYVVAGRSDGSVDMRDLATGTLVWRGRVDSTMTLYEEGWGGPHQGMAQGDGILAVPAGSTLTVFEPVLDSRVTLTGPAAGSVVTSAAQFAFTSAVRNAQYTCTVDGARRACTSPWSPAGLSEGAHTLKVAIAYAGTGGASTRFVYDEAAPSAVKLSFSSAVTRGGYATARWAATDRGSGVAQYQLRVGRARAGQTVSTWKVQTSTKATTKTFWLPRNTKVCVSVRAADGSGNWTPWSTARCVRRT